MTDEVINALANVPGLQVSSRTSSFALKGRRDDVRTLGALLGVSAVLEGSVRKIGHRLRLTAQLTDVEEGRLLWSERYDREDTDVFALQDELARAIVDRLRDRLVGPVGEPVPRRATASLAAYTLYLKGRYAWNKRSPEGTQEAIRLFNETIAADPGYALAYTGLADAHALQVDYRIAPVTEGMAAARQMAERALSLDDTLAEAHTSLAWVTFIHDWDWARAGAEFRRAIELNPRYPTARQWYAWYLGAMGRLAEAVAEAERAVDLDPASISIQRGLGWLYALARQPERAVARLERAMVMNPEAVETLIVLGVAQEQAGRIADAEASVREALTISPDDTSGLATLARILVRAGRREEALALRDRFADLGRSRYISPSDAAKLALALGDHDGAFAALDRAFDERRGWLVYLKADPLFDPIRGDGRFGALVRRMRLPG
jgi:serine/threonine-protein kinase